MHTPGHAGGTAFRKTPVGKAFYDFYGENIFRTDLSVCSAQCSSSALCSTTPAGLTNPNATRHGSSVPT